LLLGVVVTIMSKLAVCGRHAVGIYGGADLAVPARARPVDLKTDPQLTATAERQAKAMVASGIMYIC
jgi:hypothetical protein